MGFFHVFKIVQMVPNRAKYHKCASEKKFIKLNWNPVISQLSSSIILFFG